jgi:geranylgeranyl pyrophosphate synthase
MAMLEIIHAGSMIVDDIEDGSGERRGAPAVHLLHGLPLALNAGNWMYFAPLELLDALELPAEAERRLRRRTTRVLLDCHFGQALDLGSRVAEVPQDRLADVAATISTLKTGRLLSLAAEAGAAAAGADAATSAALAAFGEALGVGLQMLDDLGNLSARTAADKRYEDLRHGRVTWVWAWAAAQLDPGPFARLVAASGRAAAHDSGDGPRAHEAVAATLRALVGAQGRVQAHWHLREALARLRAVLGLGRQALVDGMEQELARLETSYV